MQESRFWDYHGMTIMKTIFFEENKKSTAVFVFDNRVKLYTLLADIRNQIRDVMIGEKYA